MSKQKIESFSASRFTSKPPIQIMVGLMNRLSSPKDIEDLFAEVLSELKSIFGSNETYIYTLDRKSLKPIKKYHRIGKTGVLNKEDVTNFEIQHFLSQEILSTKQPKVLFTNPDNASYSHSDTLPECQIALPLLYNEHVHSILFVRSVAPRKAEKNLNNLAIAISNYIGVHLTKLEDQEYTQHFKARVRKIIVSKVTELEAALEKADRYNQSLKDFSYIVSHDLREPLRTINSYIKLLDRRYRDQFDEDAHTFMDFVTDGVARMDELIKDLLAFSRVENSVYQFEETNLENILVLTKNSLRLKLEESEGKIISDPLPTILASRSHIGILFQNLIDNAIKFRSPDRKPVIKLKVTESENYWQFSLEDNGIGMDLEHKNHERIFKVFQRLQSFDSKIPGTGIGLAICKNIVLAHDGNIWVNSIPGKGSTFHFTISKSLRAS